MGRRMILSRELSNHMRSRARQVSSSRPPALLVREPDAFEHNPVRSLKRRRRIELSLGAAVPLLLIAAWQLLAEMGSIDTRFLPAPSTVLTGFGDMIGSGVLWEALRVSLQRIAIGFLAGSALGMVVGYAMAMSRYLRASLDPILSALYTVPKLALLPLLLLIFGLGETPVILTIVGSVFFFMWISTMSAFSSIPDEYLEAAAVFNASWRFRFAYIQLPAALPEIFTGLRLSIGMSVLVVVGIEFVNGDRGIGFLIWNSWQLFLAQRMYVGIVTVAVMGVALTGLVQAAGWLLMPWRTGRASPVRRRRPGTKGTNAD